MTESTENLTASTSTVKVSLSDIPSGPAPPRRQDSRTPFLGVPAKIRANKSNGNNDINNKRRSQQQQQRPVSELVVVDGGAASHARFPEPSLSKRTASKPSPTTTQMMSTSTLSLVRRSSSEWSCASDGEKAVGLSTISGTLVGDVWPSAGDGAAATGGDSLDAVFQDCGQFSRYQKLLVFLVLLPCSIPCGLHQFDQVLMGFTPDHHCRVGPNVALPSEGNGETSKCWEYEFGNKSDSVSICDVEDCPVVPCRDGWEFDSEEPPSIVSEFELVCSADKIPPIGLCIFQVANALGVPIFGYLADRFGRKKSFVAVLSLQLVATLATNFTPNVAVFFVCRFLVGLTVPACFIILGIYGLEFVGPDYRILVSVLQCSFFTAGLCTLAGLAYFFPAWKAMNYATSVAVVPLFALIWWAPESPRWSLLNDKLKATHEVFLKIRGGNSVREEDSKQIWRRLQAVQEAEKRELELEAGFFQSIRKLAESRRMRNKTLLTTYLWATALTVYIGLGYYGPGIHPNPYLGFFLSSAIEFLCYPPAYWYMSRIGRRPAYAFTLFLGGASAIGAVAVPEGNSSLLMAVFLLAKLSIAAAFLITIPFAGETYPTELRAFGFALGSAVGGLVCVPAPGIVYLGAENLALPLIIFGCLAVVGSFLSLFLPETLGEPMAQTVAEADRQKLETVSSVLSAKFVKSLFTVKV